MDRKPRLRRIKLPLSKYPSRRLQGTSGPFLSTSGMRGVFFSPVSESSVFKLRVEPAVSFPKAANRLLAPVEDLCETWGVKLRLCATSRFGWAAARRAHSTIACGFTCFQTVAGVAKWQTHRT